MPASGEKLRFALSKGRILNEELELLRKVGVNVRLHERELSLETDDFVFWLIKPQDVITWVESGVVDLGIVGLDLIREAKRDVLELMDLRIGRCRFSLACKEEEVGRIPTNRKVYIATKLPNLTREYASAIFGDFEIIHLHGSVEVAPDVGLAHYITDLVSTGRTLKENGLVEVKILCEISAYLISNRTSFIIKYNAIESFLKILHETVNKDISFFL